MIALISDIHGNYPALKSVISDIKRYRCDRIISLGDVAGYYCMINECIELCREEGVLNICGNHDDYLISGTGCPRSTSANICLAYQSNVITEENLKWLRSSVSFIEDEDMSLRHGGWKNPLDEYIDDFSFEMVSSYKQTIFASGHTHIQCMKRFENHIYLNPGSVGQPRDHIPTAAYSILTNDFDVIMRRVEYPIGETIAAMKKCGFQDRISECLLRGTKIGEII